MPSNTQTDESEASGQSVLPLARIKKIIQLDEDIAQCSHNATFLIAIATELFIQYLAEQGYNVVKSERKPRKMIQYKDLATAVSRIDNLEFLADVIPKTTTYRQYKEKRAREGAQDVPKTEMGQPSNAATGQNGVARLPGGQTTLFAATNGSRANMVTENPIPTVSMMIDPTGNEAANGDVEMTG
ncbi:histone-like transcription factor, putative [Talaromyces stipitatus ATCC 10500]|uniref:Histone-like transcription factor, putative n=1 Tax=Talaromyces stipitatus (strain ATCC 10500 / CBS 375.48 / QM 6759 / NRRL 1006) TaxID=441959 RepID=B8M1N4_TALSN|nr:histone-like transcription factor, putative [Talaromyces stipitatus ATCC 10500]EED22121.1 histone-like transcription factor, putative [Talaromyces stipitatus ATCC 10500]